MRLFLLPFLDLEAFQPISFENHFIRSFPIKAIITMNMAFASFIGIIISFMINGVFGQSLSRHCTESRIARPL